MSERESTNHEDLKNSSEKEFVQPIQELIPTLNDSEGIIDDDFIHGVGELFAVIGQEREYLQESSLTHDQKLVLLHTLYKMYIITKDWKRKDGTSTFSSHWLGTAKYLVHMTGRTHGQSLLIALLHDWIEDLTAKREKGHDEEIADSNMSPEDLLEAVLSPDTFKDHLEKYDQKQVEKVRKAVVKAVRGLTKIKKKSREETNRGYFVRQLRTILNTDLRVSYAKLSDRGDNIDTISAHDNPERERDIMKETEQINLAMARELKIPKVVSHMTDACMEFFNPDLAEEFNTYAENRLQETLIPFQAKIINRIKAHSAVKSVFIRVKNLADYTPATDKAFEDFTFDDLGISERDPMFEIIVTTKSEDDERKEIERKNVSAHIYREFGDDSHAVYKSQNTPSDDRMKLSPWTESTVSNPKYPTQLHFKIRSDLDQRKSKRGLVADYSDETPDHIRTHIAAVLSATERKIRQSKDERVAARKEFLRPTMTVFTKRGVPKEVPIGTTGLDLAQIVHKDFLRGLQSMIIANSPVSRGSEKPFSIFDPLEADRLYIFESCLQSENPDYKAVKIRPSWLLFCHRGTARTIRKFLRHPLHLKTLGEQTVYLKKLGFEYLMLLSKVCNLNYQRLGNLMEKKNSNSDMPQIRRDVGCGKINPLLQIAESVQQPQVRRKETEGEKYSYRRWDIKVELINKEDQYRQFIEVLNREGGVNIGILKQPEEDEAGIFKLRLEVDANISTYDFLRRLVRTSFDYQVSIDQTLRYKKDGL